MYIEVNYIEEFDIEKDKNIHVLVCRDYMSGDKKEIFLRSHLSDGSEVCFYVTDSVASDFYETLKRHYEKEDQQ